jgi:hypothetical protein
MVEEVCAACGSDLDYKVDDVVSRGDAWEVTRIAWRCTSSRCPNHDPALLRSGWTRPRQSAAS